MSEVCPLDGKPSRGAAPRPMRAERRLPTVPAHGSTPMISACERVAASRSPTLRCAVASQPEGVAAARHLYILTNKRERVHRVLVAPGTARRNDGESEDTTTTESRPPEGLGRQGTRSRARFAPSRPAGGARRARGGTSRSRQAPSVLRSAPRGSRPRARNPRPAHAAPTPASRSSGQGVAAAPQQLAEGVMAERSRRRQKAPARFLRRAPAGLSGGARWDPADFAARRMTSRTAADRPSTLN